MNVVVCGGAKTLVSDIKKCPTDAIKVSANHHAANMLDCEYVVYFHDIVLDYIKWLPVTPIDVKTNNIKVHGYVGTSAVQFALESLRANKVYLAGFDLYQSMYFHEYDGKLGGARHPKEIHEGIWSDYLDTIDVNRLIPISGPLEELIWRAKERKGNDSDDIAVIGGVSRHMVGYPSNPLAQKPSDRT